MFASTLSKCCSPTAKCAKCAICRTRFACPRRIATGSGFLDDALHRWYGARRNPRAMNDYHPYQFLAVFLVVAVLFALLPLGLARLWAKKFSPQKSGPHKNAVYECGLESTGSAAIQFKSQYYIYAIVFLIFDVETLFLLPFAVAFTELSFGAFVAMMVFVLLLAEGLVWAWLKGILVWK